MFNESTIGRQDELHAYNAAFHELGLRWHWDDATYSALLAESDDARQRIALYLERAHPHLLRAYDADFLIEAIEVRKGNHLRYDASSGTRRAPAFDWAATCAGEIGV